MGHSCRPPKSPSTAVGILKLFTSDLDFSVVILSSKTLVIHHGIFGSCSQRLLGEGDPEKLCAEVDTSVTFLPLFSHKWFESLNMQ